MNTPAILTEDLTKFYGRARGIEGLNLRVDAGEFFGFIGPNGAGKSTTIRLLLGLIRPTSGSAKVLDLGVGRDQKEILRRVGYLPSDVAFYSRMKVRDVLRLSANLRGRDCSARAEELCERLQLDRDRRADALSLGNKKKVGIVCALQHDPELLIMDEPTSGLDPLVQHEFFDILNERNRAGATIFLSSHVLSEVQRHCTRAAVIREGAVIACDTMEALGRSSARRVTLRGGSIPAGLPGVRDLSESDGTVSFLYSGDMNELVRCLAATHVDDLTIAEPDLEEAFLHYYEKGGDRA
ncbi:MAG: ABC transporter ATP-binding protein [Clostridia bacterium]|nr:ABC transporter ATP-binding protein [Clostridia bacterium]